MAAAIGFLMIIVIVALLLKGKMSPIVVLAIVPTIWDLLQMALRQLPVMVFCLFFLLFILGFCLIQDCLT